MPMTSYITMVDWQRLIMVKNSQRQFNIGSGNRQIGCSFPQRTLWALMLELQPICPSSCRFWAHIIGSNNVLVLLERYSCHDQSWLTFVDHKHIIKHLRVENLASALAFFDANRWGWGIGGRGCSHAPCTCLWCCAACADAVLGWSRDTVEIC